MSTYIVFDTETTGLPPRGNVTEKNWRDWDKCRIVQLAWEVHASSLCDAPLVQRSYIVKPDGFTVPREVVAIHGISTQRALAEGVPIARVIDEFIGDISQYRVSTAVAHNMSFDDNVLLAELYRIESELAPAAEVDSVATWKSLTKECTMRLGTKPGGRWPKLDALYKDMCGPLDPDVKLHDAGTDTRLCAEIYRALKAKAELRT